MTETTPPIKAIFKYSALGILPQLAFTVVSFFLTIFLVEHLNYSISEATSLYGITAVINAFMGVIVGGVVDSLNHKLVSRLGLCLPCLLPIVLVWVPHPSTIFAALILSSFGTALFSNVVVQKIHAQFNEIQSRKIYSYYYAAGNGAVFIAPLLVFVAGYDRLEEIFMLAIGLELLVIIGYWSVSKKTVSYQQPFSFSSLRQLLTNKILISIFICSFCYSLVYNQYFTNVPLIISNLKLDGKPIYPILVSLNGILVIILQLVYIKLCTYYRPLPLLKVGTFLVLASFTVLAVAPLGIYSLFGFSILFTLGEVFINPAITSLILSAAPEGRKGVWLGAMQLSRVSGGLGVTMGGLSLQYVGQSFYLASLIVTTIPMVIVSLFIAKPLGLIGKAKAAINN